MLIMRRGIIAIKGIKTILHEYEKIYIAAGRPKPSRIKAEEVSIDNAQCIIVLLEEGASKNPAVSADIRIARDMGLPVYFI